MIDWFTDGSVGGIVLMQIAVLPVAALVGAHLMRERPARAHALLVAGLAVTVLAPVATLLVHAFGLGGLPGPELQVEAIVATAAVDGDETARTSWSTLTVMMLIVIWGAWTTVHLTRTAIAFARGCRLSRDAQPWTAALVDPALRWAHVRACNRVGCPPDAISLLASESIPTPAIFAWSRPARVLFPMARLDDLSPTSLEAILVHEIAHRQRRDHLTRLLVEIVAGLVPWNPAVVVARRMVERLSDRACDQWVVAAGHAPETYADTLLQFAQERMGAMPCVAALSSDGALAERIRMILDAPAGAPSCGRRYRRLLAALMLAIPVGLAFAQPGPLHMTTLDYDAALLAVSPVQAAPSSLDLGIVEPGGTGRGTLRLVNLGERPVRLLTKKAACGCTTIEGFKPRLLEPGDTHLLTITMLASPDANATKQRTITFTFDEQEPLSISVQVTTGE